MNMRNIQMNAQSDDSNESLGSSDGSPIRNYNEHEKNLSFSNQIKSQNEFMRKPDNLFDPMKGTKVFDPMSSSLKSFLPNDTSSAHLMNPQIPEVDWIKFNLQIS